MGMNTHVQNIQSLDSNGNVITDSDGNNAVNVVTAPGGFVMPGGGSTDVKKGFIMLDNSDATEGTALNAYVPSTQNKIHTVTFDTLDARDTLCIRKISSNANNGNDDSFHALFIQGTTGDDAGALNGLSHSQTYTGAAGVNDQSASSQNLFILPSARGNDDLIIPLDFAVLRVDITSFYPNNATFGGGAPAGGTFYHYEVSAWTR